MPPTRVCTMLAVVTSMVPVTLNPPGLLMVYWTVANVTPAPETSPMPTEPEPLSSEETLDDKQPATPEPRTEMRARKTRRTLRAGVFIPSPPRMKFLFVVSCAQERTSARSQLRDTTS